MRSLYEIAVRMTMVNEAGAALSTIANQVMGIHGHLNAATAASSRFRTALMGAGAALLGSGLLAGMAKLVDHGGEFNRVVNQMRLQAWPGEQLQRAVEQSFSLSRRYASIGAAEILTMMREMAPDQQSRLHPPDAPFRRQVRWVDLAAINKTQLVEGIERRQAHAPADHGLVGGHERRAGRARSQA